MVRTIVIRPPPPDLETWLEMRRRGLDLFDEVWEGEHHVARLRTRGTRRSIA